MSRRRITVDANEAVASVAYRAHEVIALYPITPATPMGELCDRWASAGRTNLWGEVPEVVGMQSDSGAAGTLHGALQAGALATTFTASQGLLTMLPDLYRIAGGLLPGVIHVAARALATHALSIYGDHSDVMAARAAGWAMLAAGSPQEAHDFALLAQAASLASRIPFLHFFDGFRTSHEMRDVVELSDDDLRAILDPEHVLAHRRRALSPARPTARGTTQGPDTFFPAREATNPFYAACPGAVRRAFERFAELTGRRYHLFDYHGHPAAERVIVVMGSGGECVEESVLRLADAGEKVGVVKVRLYRPFDAAAFAEALPTSARAVAVLDRTKEPGAPGEPLYLDVGAALRQTGRDAVVVGGRYGLASRELRPGDVKAVFDELTNDAPSHGFTLGIVDDVTGASLQADTAFEVEDGDVSRAVFFGLGSDGTVASNKSTLEILTAETDLHVQGYFVYDADRAGPITVSHLRFGPRPIRSTYLVREAGFVACHHPRILERRDVLAAAAPGAVFLLNAPWPPDEVWGRLPREVQEEVVAKGLRLWVVDAADVARRARLPGRIAEIMQAAFFALAEVLPREAAIDCIKGAIARIYEGRGPVVVRMKQRAVDEALDHLCEVTPGEVTSEVRRRPPVAPDEPEVTAVLLAGQGAALPVSAFPVDGTWPVATGRYVRRNLARAIPIWEPDVCIQCNQCAFVCPHTALRVKVYEPDAMEGAPEGFRSAESQAHDFEGLLYTLQVSPEDCTGCGLCVEVCPAKDRRNPRRKAINQTLREPSLETERRFFDFFRTLPQIDRRRIVHLDAKTSQFLEPLFEAPSACPGCGETPYLRLLTQLFGERLEIANATGCSSVYGGHLPTAPWTSDKDGRGPAWAHSLFEDNAEFGFGFRLAVDSQLVRTESLLIELAPHLGDELVRELLETEATDASTLAAQRSRLAELGKALAAIDSPAARELETLADVLLPRSLWLVGGDGWAYDIGYGGLEHVLASGRNVNVLVLDNEVCAVTGGQQSKATPLGATAKLAIRGKETPKKDLGMEVMSFGDVYVARVAFGANMNQTVEALVEADSYPGPSLVIAYAHCVAHGYDLSLGAFQQKKAVASGVWPLYRFDPRRREAGEAALHLDAAPPSERVADYVRGEARFRLVEKLDPERFKTFLAETEKAARERHALYRKLAGVAEE